MPEFQLPYLARRTPCIEKLDRLEWVEGMCFKSYGLRIGLRVNKPGMLEQVLPYLPPGWKPAASRVVDRMYSIIEGGKGRRPGMRLYNLVYADFCRAARVPEMYQAINAFESDLQLYVAEMSPNRVFIHAGVVSLGGKAIVIPGRSFSGKTTLTAELVKAGAVYYSDEYAVLDAKGRVHHYARPLSIRENAHLERPKKYPVESLGGRRGSKPLPVSMVIVSKYTPGATWRPRELSAGEGALELMANAVGIRREPKHTLAALQQVVAGATILKGKRGEAGQVIDYILEKLGA